MTTPIWERLNRSSELISKEDIYSLKLLCSLIPSFGADRFIYILLMPGRVTIASDFPYNYEIYSPDLLHYVDRMESGKPTKIENYLSEPIVKKVWRTPLANKTEQMKYDCSQIVHHTSAHLNIVPLVAIYTKLLPTMYKLHQSKPMCFTILSLTSMDPSAMELLEIVNSPSL